MANIPISSHFNICIFSFLFCSKKMNKKTTQDNSKQQFSTFFCSTRCQGDTFEAAGKPSDVQTFSDNFKKINYNFCRHTIITTNVNKKHTLCIL